ncbi:hypothetical protein [Myxococcus phage Mx1]|nr:hypothetical protein [Myxococcus phage Mx1]
MSRVSLTCYNATRQDVLITGQIESEEAQPLFQAWNRGLRLSPMDGVAVIIRCRSEREGFFSAETQTWWTYSLKYRAWIENLNPGKS